MDLGYGEGSGRGDGLQRGSPVTYSNWAESDISLMPHHQTSRTQTADRLMAQNSPHCGLLTRPNNAFSNKIEGLLLCVCSPISFESAAVPNMQPCQLADRF